MTDEFEDDREITQQTPQKNHDKFPFNKETENGRNTILDLTNNDPSNKTALTIVNSPDADIYKKNNSKSCFDVKKNGIGVLPTAKCTYCKDMNTRYYCLQKVVGTGCFIDGNEVCGHIMCFKCVLDWDGLAETYRRICRECKENEKEDKEKENGKTGKNDDENNEKEITGKDTKKRKFPSYGTTGKSPNTRSSSKASNV